MTPELRGASVDAVESVLENGSAVTGLDGFGGQLPDGRLVRDAIGRVPVFRDRDRDEWGFDPRDLTSPEPVPAGCVTPVGAEDPTPVLGVPDADPRDPDRAIAALRTAVTTSLDALAPVPVAFSGGVDSALVATGSDGPLYVVGFPDSPDRRTATAAADRLDRRLRTVDIDVATLETVVPIVARAINRTDAMSVSIAIPLYLLGRAVATDGFDRLALGQGADELFAGYEKLQNPGSDQRLDADTVLDGRDELVASLPAQAERDVSVLRAADVTPVTPWLSDAVIRAALQLPEPLLVADDTRKVGFRRVATDHLPADIASREKRAVQYGSGTARELDRLARNNGFKRRLGDHVSKYIASRVRGVDPVRGTGS